MISHTILEHMCNYVEALIANSTHGEYPESEVAQMRADVAHVKEALKTWKVTIRGLTLESGERHEMAAAVVDWMDRCSPQDIAFRVMELLVFSNRAKATLRMINICSTNEDFARTADLEMAEWAFGRKLQSKTKSVA